MILRKINSIFFSIQRKMKKQRKFQFLDATFLALRQNYRPFLFIGLLYISMINFMISIPAPQMPAVIFTSNKLQPISIVDKFYQRWYKLRKPLSENDNTCGYFFPHDFLNTRTADQMMQMIGNFLIATESKRKLVVPAKFDPFDQLGFSKFELLQGFQMLPGMTEYNLNTSDFEGDSSSTVLLDSLKQISQTPCGVNIGFPRKMRINGNREVLNMYYYDFEPTHYFVKHRKLDTTTRDLVKRFATFKPHIINKCRQRIYHALKEANCSTCNCSLAVAHVRRTDYADAEIKISRNLAGEKQRPLSVQYLHAAYEYVKKTLDTCTVLIVVTDDYNSTIKIVPKSGSVHVLLPSDEPLVDMCVIASADAVILSIGNFGWLGAYLADTNIVTYQSNQRIMYRPLKSWTAIDPCTYSETRAQHYHECYPATMGFNHEKDPWIT